MCDRGAGCPESDIMELVLHTNLTPEEFSDKLSASITTQRYQGIGFLGKRAPQVLGSVNGSTFWMQKRLPNGYIRPVFHGTLSLEDGGTRVEGHFMDHPFLEKLMVAWSALVVFTVCYSSFGPPIAVVAALAAAVATAAVTRWWSRRERTFILKFLKQTLDASFVGGQSDY